MSSSAFAINFGMSRSWAAIVHAGEEIIVPSPQGISSYVEFGKLEPKLCRKFTESVNASNSVYGIKRLLGRKFDDSVVQRFKKHSPLDIGQGSDGRPRVTVEYYGERRTLLLEEVAAMIFTSLKEKIEQAVGHSVRSVVLTVPACFGEAQRRAIKDVAAIAGLDVVRLLNDTTAAAITYSLRCHDFDSNTVLTVDVGGGSTNIAVAEISSSRVRILSTAGDPLLGAEEIDHCLMKYCVAELSRNRKIDFASLPDGSRMRLRRQLKAQCIEVRQQLYSSMSARIKVDIADDEAQLEITRDAFDALTDHHMARIVAMAADAVREPSANVSRLDAIYLVGGSSRIVSLENRLVAQFPRIRLLKTYHRDEAVVKGAAIFASHLNVAAGRITVEDVLGRALFLQPLGGETLQALCHHNEVLPARIKATVACHQTTVDLKVMESSGSDEKIHEASHFILSEVVQERPLTNDPIQLEFVIDMNGLLSMTATQETVYSTRPSAKASFRTALTVLGKRSFLDESIGFANDRRELMTLIESGRLTEQVTTVTKSFTTTATNQSELEIEIYKSNALRARHSDLVGALTVSVPDAPIAVPRIDLTVNIDRNFLLTATAVCQPCAITSKLVVFDIPWGLSLEAIHRMRKDRSAKQEAFKSKESLQLYCYELGGRIEEMRKCATVLTRLENKLASVLTTLEEAKLCEQKEYDRIRKELETLYDKARGHTQDAPAPRQRNGRGVLGAFMNVIMPGYDP